MVQEVVMSISVFELFSIGIGPSSSHTVGPMRAAKTFANKVHDQQLIAQTQRVQVDLYGSLALTGKGHGTDLAILNGLENQTPEGIDPEQVHPRVDTIKQTQQLLLNGEKTIHFNMETDLLFHQKEILPHHSNGMRFTAYSDSRKNLFSEVYYSIGGGFIVNEENFSQKISSSETTVPYIFNTAHQLLQLCEKNQLSIAQLMLENEKAWLPEEEVKTKLLNIAQVMNQCIQRGATQPGILPGGLQVKRRAPDLFKRLLANKTTTNKHTDIMNWLNLYALAVNEENAAGGRVVTAPTNGAAGVLPAVLNYYIDFCEGANDQGVIDYLLTAGAIAILYKKGASISAAEVGCQGEIGVACSMAAGALAAVLGGSIWQVENAAEIGMEHHLGLTCDPIAGLVQIPCIERNAMAAVQAVNAAQLTLMEEGSHKVSLDKVIATMLQTGKDMQTIYKETSQGGLAVNQPEC